VERARELYEQETGQPLRQIELAHRLSTDGYPIQQSHISRMSDAVRYLLPAIPTVLYAGLGRHQVERLVVMRNMGKRIWERYARDRDLTLDFDDFFQDVLTQFDGQKEELSPTRVQDELIGQMSELFDVAYDLLMFEVTEPEVRRNALRVALATPLTPPTFPEPAALVQPTSLPQVPLPIANPMQPTLGRQPAPPTAPGSPQVQPHQGQVARPEAKGSTEAQLQDHIVSPAQTTERLQSIQTLIAEQLGEAPPPDFASNVLQSIPVQAGGLYPISDIWHIDPGLDEPQRLRTHIAQFAREIADEASLPDSIEDCADGIGFICHVHAQHLSASGQTVLALLSSIAAQHAAGIGLDDALLHRALPALLHGQSDAAPRLSDTALVKLFRLIRLARRLVDLEASIVDDEG